MKNSLLSTMLMSCKAGLVACMILVLLPAYSHAAQSLSFGVTFGTAQDDGGPCVGKGVCKESFDMDVKTGIYTSNPEAVTVTFQISPNDSNVLMMSFLMSELQIKQPDKVSTFTEPSYGFDAPDGFISTTLSALTFPAGAAITADNPGKVKINGDIVTVYLRLVND